MPETYDVLSSRITPASTADTDRPLVNGTFAVPGDEYTGMAGTERVWTEDALRDAADELVGKPLTTSQDGFDPHPGVKRTDSGLEVAPQPPVASRVGTVTDARYDDDLGVIWQGELAEDALYEQVANGWADVSPVVALETEPLDDGREEIVATTEVRDLTILGNGDGALPGNSITPGAAEAMTVAADALAQAFDLDESAEPDDTDGDSADADDGAGAGAGDPVPVSEGDDPKTADVASTPEADATNDDNDEDSTRETMADNDTDLTDEERGLLAQARKRDEPAVIEQDDAQRLDDADALLAAADDVDGDVTVVAESEYDALTARVASVESMMDAVLREETGLKESTVDAMAFEAKAAEFEDDDGEFQVDALVQTPATGDVATDSDSDSDTVDLDALSEEEREELDSLTARAETFDAIDEAHAETLREEAADLAGAEDFDALAEVLD